jgi:hydrogenase nickel incorporation protein HypA/HybF
MSIVQALLEQVESEVTRSGHAGRVVQLDLVIGRLSGVHVDSIKFAFELLAPGSMAEGARLSIEEPQARMQCQACGAERVVEDLTVCCPGCGRSEITIVGGQELLLSSIELEDESPIT